MSGKKSQGAKDLKYSLQKAEANIQEKTYSHDTI